MVEKNGESNSRCVPEVREMRRLRVCLFVCVCGWRSLKSDQPPLAGLQGVITLPRRILRWFFELVVPSRAVPNFLSCF